MDADKVKAIQDWPTPGSVKEVERFIGLVNYYRRFIRNFSVIARPLHDLKRQDRAWRWGRDESEAFLTLKNALSTAPTLRIPDPEKPFRLTTDASDFATGAILTQEHEGVYHPIAYYSRTMLPAERNYPVHDKELLAIIDALHEWRHHLEGAKFPIDIQTDNLALRYFEESHDLSRRQARWQDFLSRFRYKIAYLPGKKNPADALTRRPDLSPAEKDNQAQKVLQPIISVIST